MSEKTLDRTCDFIFKKLVMNPEEPCKLNVSGGEVLLYPEKVKKLISTIANKCKSSGLVVPSFELSTNASLLTDDMIEFFLQNNISLYIGFDGISASHNQNRLYNKTESETFKKCFENIKKLYSKEGNKKTVTLNNVISSTNVQWINANFDFLYDTFPGFMFTYNIAYNAEWNDTTLQIFNVELNKLAEKYIEIITAHDSRFELGIFDRQMALNIAEKTASIPRCGACEGCFGISPEGYIEACTQLTGLNVEEYSIVGNLEQGLNKNKAKIFRESLLIFDKLASCVECDFNNRCYNYCPSTNYLSSSDIYTVSESQCEINRILIYVADFIINELGSKKPELLESRFIKR